MHFIHIGKTGGTAIKSSLRQAGLAYSSDEALRKGTRTPYGYIQLHSHGFRLRDVPPGDHAFFCVRDPVDRFMSAFYSRLTEGRPRYYSPWTERERRAFEMFATPQRLAAALASDDAEERSRADWALRSIRHTRRMRRWIGKRRELEARLDQVVYIARLETLDADWEQLKRILTLPRRLKLPKDQLRSHRGDASLDRELDDAARTALTNWYRPDYRLLKFCERVRSERGWAPPQSSGRRRLRPR